MRQTTIAVWLVTALLTLAAPVLAGGWATVRLDKPVVGDVPVNKPWQFSFMVLQHDVTPTNDVTPIVRARHTETGEEVTATAHQEGPVGHFVAELTLPLTGEWKWAIIPEPFAETSFPTLTVLDRAGVDALAWPAGINAGRCTALGDMAFALGDITPQPIVIKSAQTPVAIGAATIDVSLPTLLATDHAISVGVSKTDAALVACGDVEDLSGTAVEDQDELVLGLRRWSDARNVGVAVLRPEGQRTAVRLYLLDLSGAQALPTTGATTTVEIVGAGFEDAAFQPQSVTVSRGDTVTWVNTSDIAHTITGDDLTFADSGLLDPGQSFSQTFDEAGTYRYRC